MNKTVQKGMQQPLVLVADDDALIRTVVRLCLEAMNLSVLEASSGAEAVAVVGARDLALVVLDVRFPGEIFEQIWVDLVASRRPPPAIIVLSGDATGPVVAQGPHVEFLRKPVELAVLRTTVTRLLTLAQIQHTP